jgi:hypothetical protein
MQRQTKYCKKRQLLNPLRKGLSMNSSAAHSNLIFGKCAQSAEPGSYCHPPNNPHVWGAINVDGGIGPMKIGFFALSGVRVDDERRLTFKRMLGTSPHFRTDHHNIRRLREALAAAG